MKLSFCDSLLSDDGEDYVTVNCIAACLVEKADALLFHALQPYSQYDRFISIITRIQSDSERNVKEYFRKYAMEIACQRSGPRWNISLATTIQIADISISERNLTANEIITSPMAIYENIGGLRIFLNKSNILGGIDEEHGK